MYTLVRVISWIFQIYEFLILIRVLLSWINVNPYRPAIDHPLVQVLHRITDPILEPLRRLIPPIGGTVDVSPIVAIIILETGLRVGEALALRPEDLDGENHQLVVRKSKSGRARRVDVTDYLVELLKKTPKDLIDKVIYLTQGKLYFLVWLKSHLGTVVSSPRKDIFWKKAQDFEIVDVDEPKERVKIRFEEKNSTVLPLTFSMFDRAIESEVKGISFKEG